MGLTYDGITYRSLEEQVRYDAEQVQSLKQADVTINESLQTVNTEIDGKLTKPANPSAESAVTMLADGTVGTKLLSEIGGGGGKLYEHKIRVTFRYNSTKIGTVMLNNIYTTSNTKLTTYLLLSHHLDTITGIGCTSNITITNEDFDATTSIGSFYFLDEAQANIFLIGDLSLNSTISMINDIYNIIDIVDTVTEL